MKTAPNDRADLARLLPELVDRDLPSDRQHQIREFVMSHITQQRARHRWFDVTVPRRRPAEPRPPAGDATPGA